MSDSALGSSSPQVAKMHTRPTQPRHGAAVSERRAPGTVSRAGSAMVQRPGGPATLVWATLLASSALSLEQPPFRSVYSSGYGELPPELLSQARARAERTARTQPLSGPPITC